MEPSALVWQRREARQYVSDLVSDFYNHGSVTADPSAWAVWQYHDPKSGEGVVLAFRRGGSPCDRVKIAIKGIAQGAEITLERHDENTVSVAHGVIEVVLPQRRSSAVLAYRQELHQPLPRQSRTLPASAI